MIDKRNKSDAELPWTGERFLPDVNGNIELEHMHRYTYAKNFVGNLVVADIASGEGYGSNLLSSAARQVIGVDISLDAVSFAQKKYKKENLEFRVGSAANIPIDTESVDVVVSFETIEHHDQHTEMMKEIKRILKPRGLLIISSPNKQYYSIERGYKNPFHVKELFFDEFKGLLEEYFSSISFFQQRVAYGSLLIDRGMSKKFQTIDYETVVEGLFRADYDLAFASDYVLPEFSSSLFEISVGGKDRSEYMSEVYENSLVLNRKNDDLDALLKDSLLKTHELEVTVDILSKERDQAVEAQRILSSNIDKIYNTFSWKVTHPFRCLRTFLAHLQGKMK